MFAERFGAASDYGLAEGSVPPRSFCWLSGTITNPPTWDKVTDVLGSLLLAEVAVSANVTAVDPGFRAGGAPVLRLSLSDVEPLHVRSPRPEYVLVPVGRLVVRDRVYCGDKEEVRGRPPAVGDRLIVVGPWMSHATVNVGHIGISSLAFVEGDRLDWVLGRDGPETLGQLEELIRDSEAEGLFDLTSSLAKMPYGTEAKHVFGKDWNEFRLRDCPPAVERRDGEARLVCRHEEIEP